MSDRSSIEWTDATWNPVTGCTEVSPGCDNCYARTFAERFRNTSGHYYEHGFDVMLRPEKLDQPLRWKKPRRVFVNSMSDLFHAAVPDEYIAKVFAVMALTHRHTFQVLTKRHGRMRALLSSDDFRVQVGEEATELMAARPWNAWQLDLGGQRLAGDSGIGGGWQVTTTSAGNLWSPPWPLPNVWLGVSVENQKWADIRIPALLDTPAAVRFLSCEPLLGQVDLGSALPRPLCDACEADMEAPMCNACYRNFFTAPHVGWVIAGGESGRGARPMHPDWVRSLRDQCVSAGVPFLFKQWGVWVPVRGSRGAVTRVLASGRVLQPGDLMIDHDHPMAPVAIRRIGKQAAGRELDGRSWDEYPRGIAPRRMT